MSRTSFQDFNCSLARAADILGDKWTLVILRDAFYGFRRFGQFQDRLGVAKTVLSDRLTKLVESGLMERSEREGRAVDYRLTEMGRDLFPTLVALTQWGDQWIHGEDGAPVDIVHRESGALASPIKVVDSSGQALDAATTTFKPGPGANEQTHHAFARGNDESRSKVD